jgi:hypothetical protein
MKVREVTAIVDIERISAWEQALANLRPRHERDSAPSISRIRRHLSG